MLWSLRRLRLKMYLESNISRRIIVSSAEKCQLYGLNQRALAHSEKGKAQ